MWFRPDSAGSRQTIPLRFTSLAPPDPYRQLAGGASWHRMIDLTQLRQLIDGLRQEELGDA